MSPRRVGFCSNPYEMLFYYFLCFTGYVVFIFAFFRSSVLVGVCSSINAGFNNYGPEGSYVHYFRSDLSNVSHSDNATEDTTIQVVTEGEFISQIANLSALIANFATEMHEINNVLELVINMTQQIQAHLDAADADMIMDLNEKHGTEIVDHDVHTEEDTFELRDSDQETMMTVKDLAESLSSSSEEVVGVGGGSEEGITATNDAKDKTFVQSAS